MTEKYLNDPDILMQIGVTSPYFLIGSNQGRRGWYDVSTKGEGKTGWKLHVSASTREAQEELLQAAMKHRLPEFKFAGEKLFDKFQNSTHPQAGKTAVFYHYERNGDGVPLDWENFIREAEAIVHKHGGPGPAVQHDRPIAGSRAVYYRNSTGANGSHYVPREGLTQYGQRKNIPEGQLFNLNNAPDPFQHIDLSVPAKGKATEVLLIQEAAPLENTAARVINQVAGTGEKAAQAAHGYGKWIIGGIALATVGVGAFISFRNKKHAEQEMERRKASRAPAPGPSLY